MLVPPISHTFLWLVSALLPSV